MHSATQSLFESLDRAEWFSSAGRPIAGVGRVTDWKTAIALSDGPDWEDLRHEMTNQIRNAVREHSMDRYNHWNDVVRSIKVVLEPLLARKVEPVMRTYGVPDSLRIHARWDLLFAAVELEYAEFEPPTFFRELAEIYRNGHFPCGWEGEFPKGRVIVF